MLAYEQTLEGFGFSENRTGLSFCTDFSQLVYLCLGDLIFIQASPICEFTNGPLSFFVTILIQRYTYLNNH